MPTYNYSPVVGKTLSGNKLEMPNNGIQLFQYPNYYSGNDIKMYIRRDSSYILVAECKALAYEMSEKVMPIYGYASYTVDAWARGCRIVSGMFTVNMLGVTYLIDVIGNILNTSSVTQVSPTTEKDIGTQTFWHPTDDNTKNETVTFDLTGKPYFREQSFQIILGCKTNTVNAIDMSPNNMQSVDDVHITGVTMQMDVSGRPIEQTYSFLAKSINGIHNKNAQ